MASKNLGQVEGLYIGSSAPTNRTLIWYDTSTHVHKTYDTGLGAWTVLEQSSISAITYSALVSRAGGTGLTQGQWFKITDRSNVLALAITSTKVQYVNNNGVPVVDDLGTHVIYNITSENLVIDEITGAYDVSTNKLVFSFAEATPEMTSGDTDVDYVYGLQKRGNTKMQKKFRLSAWLSSVTGNDISWNGGFFLNFYAKLQSYFDRSGGVASYDAVEQYKTQNNQAINSINQTTQQAVQSITSAIANATTDAQIYGKRLPDAPTEGSPIDVAQNDTLSTIVNKFFRWINKFKHADGIQMPLNYAPAPTASPVNNNDSVSTAIGKLSKYATKHETGDGVTVSDSAFQPYTESQGDITNIDTLTEAIKKLLFFVTHIENSYIVDRTIEVGKIAERTITEEVLGAGIFQKDICKVKLQFTGGNAPSDISGAGIGFILAAGNQGTFKNNDNADPYEKNRGTNRVLSFAPVIPSLLGNNSDKILVAAASMPHYTGYKVLGQDAYAGATLQIIVTFTDALFATLSSLNTIWIEFSLFTIYGSSFLIGQNIVDLNQVNIFTVTLPIEAFPLVGGTDIMVEGEIKLATSRPGSE